MTSEREAKFSIAVEGDDAQIRELFAAVRKEAKTTASEIERNTQVDLFKGVDKTAKDASKTLGGLTTAAKGTGAELGRLAGEEKKLAGAISDATKAADKQADGMQGLGQSAKNTGTTLVGAFKGAILPLTGITTGVAALGAVLGASMETARNFKQALAEIGSVTNLSRKQLDELGAGARVLARDLGIDVVDALKNVYTLIRSGVDPNNALEVLRASAIASKASLAELGDGVAAADALLSGFGVSVGDIAPALDKIVVGAKNGGATLKEFGKSAGPLLNVAKQAGIGLNDLVATLTTMVNASGDASGSITALQGIILKLNTAAARDRLRELGIEGDSLVSIFTQLGERGLSLEQVLGELDIKSARSAAGVASLTNNAGQLAPNLDRVATAAGAAGESMRKLSEASSERAGRLAAELNEAKLNIAGLTGEGAFLQNVAAKLVGSMNDLSVGAQKVGNAFREPSEAVATLVRGLVNLNPAAKGIFEFFSGVAIGANQASQALQKASPAMASTADQTDRLAGSLARAAEVLRDFAPRLLESIQAIQQATSQGIGDLEAQAARQIEGLDKALEATTGYANDVLAIQMELAEKRLELIQKSEDKINELLETAIAAREASARKAGKSEQQIAQETAQARIAALAPTLSAYERHYGQLTQLSQGYAAKLRSVEQERVDFNRSIEKMLFDQRIAGLSAFDQYVAKVREVERLIGEARKAGLDGDLKTAKQYTTEAISLAQSLQEVTNDRGIKIVSALDNQLQKQNLVKQAADGYNTALNGQAQAAAAGRDATRSAIDAVIPKLDTLRGKYDALKGVVAEGLDVRIDMDQQSLNRAMQQLNDLTRPRTVTVTVQEVRTGGGTTGAATATFARGGPVRRLRESLGIAPRGYARGGPVFRNHSWNKVPGVGNEDTVPAMLREGAFVIRKQAAALYGDTRMRSIAAQRYASGGRVRRHKDDDDPFGLLGLMSGPKTGSSSSSTTSSGGYQPKGYSEATKSDYFGDMDPSNPHDGPWRQFEADVFGEPELPSDPRELQRKVLEYAHAVATAARQIDGSRFWGPALEALAFDIKAYENRPTAEKLAIILRRSRGIGLNLGITGNERRGFDIDGRRFHKTPARAPAGLANARLYSWEFYNEGGQPRGTDRVRALLTPGEWVMPVEAVRKYGTNFMAALNDMRIPTGTLDAMFTPPPPPRVHRFAEGGEVPGGWAEQLTGTGNFGRYGDQLKPQSLTVNVNANAGDLLNEANVRRFILPVMREIQRRSR